MNNRWREFFESGVQYGHKTQSWNPKMKPFIWGKKDSIHLINVSHTDSQLTAAEILLKKIASSGLPILWVGTKKAVCKEITRYALESGSPFFANRWVGGTLTNSQEVKRAVKKMLLNEEIYQKSESQDIYTKKELNLLQKKVERSKKIISGIEKLTFPIGALIVADVQKDRVAVREAIRIGVPVIGFVDTNADPEGISIVIPCNDDLGSAVGCVAKYLAQAIIEGKEIFKKNNEIAHEKAKLEQSIEEKKYTGYKNIDKKINKKSIVENDTIEDTLTVTSNVSNDVEISVLESSEVINIVTEIPAATMTKEIKDKNMNTKISKKTVKPKA